MAIISAGSPGVGVAERLRMTWADEPGITGFLTTVDHKRIGRRYLVTAFVFLLLGGVQALLMRLQLAGPGNAVVGPEVYNQLMTMHGTTMIFLFNTPIMAAFGNYVLPLQIGARDMAFPRLNALSYWIFLLSGAFIYASYFVGAIPEGGWFSYVPLTTDFLPGKGLDFWAIGVVFLGISTTVGGINFLVTVFKLRAPGMSVSRIPIFTWSIVAMALMIIFALPAITLAPVLLELSRPFGFQFFDAAAGGDPLLYQHLFWFWGHPEVYILLLPAMGMVSQIVSTFSGRRLVGYPWVVASLMAIAFISFGVWVHHMFVAGVPTLTASFFSAVSLIIAIPSGIQFFAWIATMWEGEVRWTNAMRFAVGAMVVFLLGGVTGVMVGVLPFDRQAHDSYFVVAHFHYVLNGGVTFPIFAAIYFWLPKMTGRMLREGLGRLSFWVMFVGFNVGFFPQHVLGLWGQPRRTFTYEAGLGWDGLNLLSSVGGFLFGLGVLITVYNFWVSLRDDDPASPNPWGAGTLEWATTSTPQPYNFLVTPLVDDRNPLWASAHEEGIVETADDETLTLAPPELEHEVMLSADAQAGPERVMEMPGPSYWPLLLSLSLLGVSVAVLVESWAFGIVAALAVIASLVAWYWPEGGEA